jgi:Na+/glutamate symporter
MQTWALCPKNIEELPMSGGGFHVHGPHDHEMEHAMQGHGTAHGEGPHHGIGGGSLTSQVALFTALIATVGAMFAYMGGATQANAGLFKNNAAIKKTEASNQWNYYQAKSSKQNLAELAIELAPPARTDFYKEEIKRYKVEKVEIQAAAKKLEAESDDWNKRSDSEMHQHHRWAQATTALQVAIALAAIALLTKRKWLVWGMLGTGLAGLVVGGLAVAHV